MTVRALAPRVSLPRRPVSSRIALTCTIALVLALIAWPICSAAAIYDVATQFSPTTNAGTWMYGEKPTSFGSFQTLTLHTAGPSSLLHDASLVGWNGADPQPTGGFAYYPFVLQNVGSVYNDINEGGGSLLSIPTGTVFMHPSPVNLSVVRFTAPETGVYALSGSFDRLQSSPITHRQEVQIVSNGVTLFDQATTGNLTPYPFSFPTLSLAAGQNVDFQELANPDFPGATMRLDATFNSATGVPLPTGASAGLVTVAAIVAVHVARVRRRQPSA